MPFQLLQRTGLYSAYTYGTNGIQPAYTYNVSYFDDAQIQSDAQGAKEINGVVIVSAHWGDENTFESNDFQKHWYNCLQIVA